MSKQAKVLVLCADGVATSTMVLVSIRETFEEMGVEADLDQGRVTDAASMVQNNKYDFVISTAGTDLDGIPEDLPLLSGVPLLTGVGRDQAFEEIKAIIENKE